MDTTNANIEMRRLLQTAGNPVFKPCAYFPSASSNDIIVVTRDCSYTEKTVKGQIAFFEANHRKWYEVWKPRLVGMMIYYPDSICRKYPQELNYILRHMRTGELTIREQLFLLKVSMLDLQVE